MKQREGFISNSSSSSFMIPKSVLTSEQIEQIRNHIKEAPKHSVDRSRNAHLAELRGKYYGKEDEWLITETEHSIQGYTSMDNFPMFSFLQKIGVPPDEILLTCN